MSRFCNLLEYINVSLFPRKRKLDKNKLGINCSFNPYCLNMSPYKQAKDIKNNLGISFVRVKLSWSHIQTSPNDPINFDIFDSKLKKLPKGMKILVVLHGCPSWAQKAEFPDVEFLNFISKVSKRYKNNSKIYGYQIGVDLNLTYGTPENEIFGFLSPERYVKFLSKVKDIIKKDNKTKTLINGSTGNINNSIEYNKQLLDFGLIKVVDVFAFNFSISCGYYPFYRKGGSFDFLSTIEIPMYITELGGTYPTDEKFACVTIPYLIKKLPNIDRVFWYNYERLIDSLIIGSTKKSSLYNKLCRK